ncbi:hypothetical protein [Desulforhopalus sp. 52FAK]
MIHSKYIVAVLIIVVAVWKFSSGTSFASSSALKYQQYKNSKTYQMLHAEDNKDIDSGPKRGYRHSTAEDNTTSDNNSDKTESLQAEENKVDTKSQDQDDSW